jgi:hypothetical protein
MNTVAAIALVPSLGPVFVSLGVIFLAVCIRDYLKTEGKLTPARKTWLTIATIFAGVGIALFVLQIVLQ